MARLTIEEKARRYDSIQKAIEIDIEHLESRIEYSTARSNTVTLMGSYNKGLADAFKEAIMKIKDLTN